VRQLLRDVKDYLLDLILLRVPIHHYVVISLVKAGALLVGLWLGAWILPWALERSSLHEVPEDQIGMQPVGEPVPFQVPGEVR